MNKGPFTYTLKNPITLPDSVVEVLNFPRMKGKYMRKFQARATQAQAQAQADAKARAAQGLPPEESEGDEVIASMEYEQFMSIGEKMLADTHGPISARLIFDEMDPDDVHEVVALVGERFAGGQTTGETA